MNKRFSEVEGKTLTKILIIQKLILMPNLLNSKMFLNVNKKMEASLWIFGGFFDLIFLVLNVAE